MKPVANRRATTVTRIATGILVAGAFSASIAHAASFQYRHPIMGMVASPTAQAKQAATEILVALTSGPTLPAGEVNWPYSYDLKQLLSVTGDPSYNASNVSWELQSGALPAGLSLGTDGVLSGIPTTKDTVGSSFQVKATYKTKSGQQAYTIVVNGAVLRVTKIVAGYNHTCAVTTTGGVKCWGANGQGQLGNNSTANSALPTDVSGLSSGVSDVSAGYDFTCALTTVGGVMCWGNNTYGNLGDGSTTQKLVPIAVSGLSGVASLSSRNHHSCVVTSTGGAKCWGSNGNGQLGANYPNNSSTPVAVTGLASGVSTITVGNEHSCAVTSAGGAKCWGGNSYGQLGKDSTVTSSSPTPVDVYSLTSGAASISAGAYHTCAVTTAGGAKCWGLNNNGQLGIGSTSSTWVPTAVSGRDSGVSSLAVGDTHSCLITATGTAMCWGVNSQGQLGNNSTTRNLTPVAVTGLTSGIRQLTGGSSHTCAITDSGPLCWGRNREGQLGNGSTTDTKVPVAVTP